MKNLIIFINFTDKQRYISIFTNDFSVLVIHFLIFVNHFSIFVFFIVHFVIFIIQGIHEFQKNIL